MAYLSSNAPLPQNSLNSPPAWKVAEANARLYENFMASRTGRERVYADLPGADSFWALGAGTAKDASVQIGASELARRSVLNGLSPLGVENTSTAVGAVGPTGQPLYAQPPAVYTLNGPGGQAMGASPVYTPDSPILPQAAPVPSQFGYLAPSQQSPVLPAAPSQSPVPAAGPCTQRGIAGIAPPWGDAFVAFPPQCAAVSGPSSGQWWALGILGAGLVGLAAMNKKRGRR